MEKKRVINMKNKTVKHCCENMDFYLSEKKVSIFYNPIFREYFINLRSFPEAKHVIYYCPWCGHEFRNSLVEKYYEILEKEYKILYNPSSKKYYEIVKEPYDEIDRKLPEEFKSDKWWKKRGL